MKTGAEMSYEVFRRRDEYLLKRKRTVSYVSLAAASLACLCVCLFFGYHELGKFMSTDLPEVPKDENIIILNVVGGGFDMRADIALMCNHFVPMSEEEICEYYGADIFPEVPADLPMKNDGVGFGIYRREDGVVYYDNTFLDYSNEDFSRYVGLVAVKCRGNFFFCVQVPSPESYSVIKGKEIALGQYEDRYFAEFTLGESHIRVESKGLSLEEFVSVIESLID